jgi:hypothetical protein
MPPIPFQDDKAHGAMSEYGLFLNERISEILTRRTTAKFDTEPSRAIFAPLACMRFQG